MEHCGWLILIVLIIMIGWSSSKDIKILGRCWIVINGRCPDSNVRTLLYTKEDRSGRQFLVTEEKDNLGETTFSAELPNKIIIHGFNSHLYSEALDSIRDEYVEQGDSNVWVVDWSNLGKGGICLPLSLRNTAHVGKCTAELVTAIKRYNAHAYIHIIATGAGTHVANNIAREFKSKRLNRITGINPAKPLIRTDNDEIKLDPSDADFVDVIHTMSFLQYSDRIGHIDIYMNPNALHQPGCSMEKQSFDCDRRRALEYYAESINSEDQFLAWACDGLAQLIVGLCEPDPDVITVGDSCLEVNRGLYISYTSKEKPYALGHWDEALYKEKGPGQRTDKIAMISNALMKHFTVLKEITPQSIKESSLVRRIKSTVRQQAEELKVKSREVGIARAKHVANSVLRHTTNRFHILRDFKLKEN